MKNHLSLAHMYWKEWLKPGDCVIDATCGNGRDTCYLRMLVGMQGKVFAVDVQPEALQATRNFLLTSFKEEELKNVNFIAWNHASFPVEVNLFGIKLVVYNLGYLPGGDKSVKTRADSTLQSLQVLSQKMVSESIISVTCYSGHEGGKEEEEKVLTWAKNLPASAWTCCHHRWMNCHEAPSLLIVVKK